jgi:hypothetical protein
MRKNLFEKMFRERHASLSLSINAIVVLIMAITMLGLGLAFMKNSMGSTMKQFTNVNEDIKAEMIKDLQSSSDRLNFKGEDVKFKAGEKREMYFAIKNDKAGTTATSFTVSVTCDGAMKEATGCTECTKITSSTFANVSIDPNKVTVGKVLFTLAATIAPDTYLCHIKILDGTTDYAKKDFYLTVE